MALRIQLSLVILMLGLAGRSWSAPLPTDGAKLVQALLLPETRLEAFRELYRRTESKRDRTSLNRFFNTEVIICPQATGAPICIVLCDEADAPPLEDADSFGSKNLERLFPAKSRKSVEFKPLLKQMATASEDEIESARISTTGPGANDHGRFHSARRILTVWEEEDALTRLKLAALLEATSYREIYVPDFLRSEFEALTPEQRKSFGMFVKWLAHQHNPPMNSLKVAKLDGAFGPQFQINH
jgi:hypothetical protein